MLACGITKKAPSPIRSAPTIATASAGTGTATRASIRRRCDDTQKPARHSAHSASSKAKGLSHAQTAAKKCANRVCEEISEGHEDQACQQHLPALAAF